ncbi:ABC transporter ATP-binding protein [Pilibacter termitis]|nr:ABC transporter ATP-binding protein [Pilibacter termitis]
MKFILVVTLVIIGVALQVAGTYLNGLPTSRIAKNLSNHEPIDFDYIKTIVILMVVFVVFYFLAKFFAGYLLTEIVQSAMFTMRKEIQEKLNRLPVSYFDKQKQGDVLSRITNDVDTLSNALQQSFISFVNAILMIAMSAVMMLYIHAMMGIIALLSIPASLLLAKFLIKKSQPSFNAQQKTLAEMNAYVQENLTGFSVLKLYGREKEVVKGFKEINDRLTTVGFRANFLSGLMNTFANFLTYYFVYIFTVVLGVQFIFAGTLLVGQLQSFLYYIYSVSTPIGQMTQLTAVLQSAFAASGRLFEFLDEQEEVAETLFTPLEVVRGEIEFEDVSFRYKADVPLIEHLNLKVPAGSMVAIVGPTGAGKTTMINLLERFYDVTDGSLKLDGIDVRNISRSHLRQQFGMVLQDSWLYEDTIRENIRFGKLVATDEEVENAGRLANVDAFIQQLPQGYDTLINAEANNLSIGQKQLLTIARAILSDPKILILDEATSSVDTRMEKLIQEAMNTLLHERTSFVIAHRLSTIRNADMIVVMNHGKIVEQGKHEELLAKNGFYAELYHSQFVEE